MFTNMGGAAGPGRAASARGKESVGQRRDGSGTAPSPAPRKCPAERVSGTAPGSRAGRAAVLGLALRSGAAGAGASPVRGRGVLRQAV